MHADVVLDLRSALAVAGEINREAVRILDVVGRHLEQGLTHPLERGTLPVWKTFISA